MRDQTIARENNGIADKKVELLAPAGNYECFLAAVCAGADAVYLAGSKFGARAYADNFSEEELLRAIRYAHLFSRKVYLTVNTLLKDTELKELADYLRPYVDAGLDAVIVQDLGVLSLVRREFPGLSVHCSTQMTITGEDGVRFAKELGAVRVVPARELSLEEIRQIKAACPDMELECFVHGAMCYCYSGQCLMSSLIGERSGNRGTCAQPCRLPYEIGFAGGETFDPAKASASFQAKAPAGFSEKEHASGAKSVKNMQTYPLSLKDLSALRLVPELIGAGIDSFKIEGRMKRAEYCAGVTAVYRSVIDRYLADPAHFTGPTPKELELVKGLYIRTETEEGYYHCHNGKHMITPGKPCYSGCDESVLADIRARYMDRMPALSVDMDVSLYAGRAARLTVRCGSACVSCEGGLVEQAEKKPLSDEAVRMQLSKTGGTPYKAANIVVRKDEAVFMPLAGLNELRRQALSALEEALLADYAAGEAVSLERTKKDAGPSGREEAGAALPAWHTAEAVGTPRRGRPDDTLSAKAADGTLRQRGYTVFAATMEQMKICMKHPLPDRVCADPYLYNAYRQTVREDAIQKEICLCFPRILRMKDIPAVTELIEKLLRDKHVAGLYVHTPDEYYRAAEILSKEGKTPSEWIASSPFLYVMNTEAARFWSQRLSRLSLPYELNEREINALLASTAEDGIGMFEMPVYGHIPMMVTANCLVRSFSKGGCAAPDACGHGYKEPSARRCGGKDLYDRNYDAGYLAILKDRTGQKMPAAHDCRYCYNTIYNGVALSLHKHMPKLQKLYKNGMLGSFSFFFTVEDACRTNAVLDYYHQGGGEWHLGAYTNGHYQRGVV